MKKADFYEGITDTLPLMFGVFPFGLAYGIFSHSMGLSSGETIAMSGLVFAGAAQFVSLPMFAEGAGPVMIGITTLLINLRHLLMGASLAPYMSGMPMSLKAVLSFGMADETYAVTISRAQSQGYTAAYQMGSNVTGYVTWLLSTAGGIWLGSYITDPLSWGLDFAMPATFLALLIPRLVDRVSVFICLISALVAVSAFIFIPGKWYIIIACLAAITAGWFMEGAYNEN